MAVKAILFDSSRCSACQACVAACKGRFGLGPASSSEDMAARAFGRAAVLDEEAPLAVARFERTLADGGTVWEAARAGCVHCAEAPCAEVCPTGALAVSGETGFVSLDAARCVGCHLCAMVCPGRRLPRHRGERGELCLCDGCGAEVAEGSVPACVAACPLDALAFDDRDAVVSRANERAAVLRERGWATRFSARCERAGWSPCSAGDEVRCGWFHARGAGVYRRGGMARCRKGGRSCVRGRPRPCRCGRRSGLGVLSPRKPAHCRGRGGRRLERPPSTPCSTTRVSKAGRVPMAMRARSWKRPLFRPLCAAATPCAPRRAPRLAAAAAAAVGRRARGGVPLVQRR